MLYHHTVVIKEWHDVVRDLLCRTTLSWRHIIGMHSNSTLVNERQQITWHHAQNVVSLRVLYKFVNFNSNPVLCLKCVFIEMLDKLITYIACWYKTLYQILPVLWTCITTSHDMYLIWLLRYRFKCEKKRSKVFPH